MQRHHAMQFKKLLGPALVFTALLFPGMASADDVFDTLKGGVQRLGEREQVIRDRSSKSQNAQLKKQSAKMLDDVDAQRRFLLARVQAFTLLPDQKPADDLITDTVRRLHHAETEMSTIESWFPKR